MGALSGNEERTAMSRDDRDTLEAVTCGVLAVLSALWCLAWLLHQLDTENFHWWSIPLMLSIFAFSVVVGVIVFVSGAWICDRLPANGSGGKS